MLAGLSADGEVILNTETQKELITEIPVSVEEAIADNKVIYTREATMSILISLRYFRISIFK